MYELKEIDCRLKIRKIYNCLLIHDNCLIIHITLTKLATKFLVSRVFFFVFSPQNKSHGLRVERGRTMETGDKNRGLTGASMHVLWRKLRRGLCKRFRAFPEQVGPWILSLESGCHFGTVEFTSVVKKKKNLNKQNDGEAISTGWVL